MKTRKQKVICRVLCMVVSIFLLASLFISSVHADTMMDTIFTQSITSTSTSRFRYRTGLSYTPTNLQGLNNLAYSAFQQASTVDLSGPQTIDYGFTAPVGTFGAVLYIGNSSLVVSDDSHTYNPGDTCFIKSGYIAVSSDTCEIYSYRITLRKYIGSAAGDPDVRFGAVVATTKQIVQRVDGIIPHEQLTLTFNQSVATTSLVLCLELAVRNTTTGGELIVTMENEFVVSYGPGKDPNYPIYPPAPGGDDIGHLDSQEQELIQDSQAGLDAGVDVMENTGNLITDLEANLNLVAFTGAFNQILNRLVLIPGLDPLVHISLSLGLFASLFGLAASIISAASHRSGQAVSESKRESRKR